jgi:hypothetical protein
MKYCSLLLPCKVCRWMMDIPPSCLGPNTIARETLRLMPILLRVTYKTGLWIVLHWLRERRVAVRV